MNNQQLIRPKYSLEQKEKFKRLKNVMKNLALMNDFKGNEFYDRQFIRHVYLAYQWVKSGSLLKAEDPQTSTQNVRISLLIEILKELQFENLLSYDDFKKKVIAEGFGVEKRDSRSNSKYVQHNNRTPFPFLSPVWKTFLNPQPELIPYFSQRRFWILIRFFNSFSCPLTSIKKTETSLFFNFTSSKGASLSIKLPANFYEKFWTDYVCSYSLIIPNEISNQGDFKLKPDSWIWIPDIIINLSHEIASHEKYNK